MVNKNVSIEERFFQKVNKTDSCWLWTGARAQGYGKFSVNGKIWQATRWSYEFHKSPIPDGLLICHTCDFPACVNPEHLWPGTHSENALDMVNKDRQGPNKTHCRKGHSYEEVGCYIRTKPAGGRQAGTIWKACKKCETDARRRRAIKKNIKPSRKIFKMTISGEGNTMTNRDTYDIEVYKEEVRQVKNGINIQINTLIDAMVDAEKCLFHNSTANLMVNSLLSEEVVPVVKETKSPFVFRGTHPDLPVIK